MRVRVGKADGATAAVHKRGAEVDTDPDGPATIVASKALGDIGERALVFPRSFWNGDAVDVSKLNGEVQRISKAMKVQSAPWIAEVPDAAAGILTAIGKGAEDRTVFWSPLAPSSLFVTTQKVHESDDVRVIARGRTIGETRLHATHDPRLSKALEREVKLLKSESTEERFVLGVVLEPNVVDSQNDYESPDDIRKAAHLFMEEYGELGTQHTEMVTGKLKVLESYIAPSDFEMGGEKVNKGTWVMGIRVVDDGLWADVKKGAFTGFSIGGSAYRTPAEKPAP